MTRRQLTHGRFIRAFEEDYTQYDGTAAVWEFVETPDSARVVALDGQGRVLLVEDHYFLQQRRMLVLPGGGVNPDEDPAAAAARELEEETGFRASSVLPLAVLDQLPSATAARAHLFVATGLSVGTMAREVSETRMELRWVPLADAVAAAREGRITDAASVAALLLAAARATPSPSRPPA
jgi:ADP-ribose pyrophosphatase